MARHPKSRSSVLNRPVQTPGHLMPSLICPNELKMKLLEYSFYELFVLFDAICYLTMLNNGRFRPSSQRSPHHPTQAIPDLIL